MNLVLQSHTMNSAGLDAVRSPLCSYSLRATAAELQPERDGRERGGECLGRRIIELLLHLYSQPIACRSNASNHSFGMAQKGRAAPGR